MIDLGLFGNSPTKRPVSDYETGYQDGLNAKAPLAALSEARRREKPKYVSTSNISDWDKFVPARCIPEERGSEPDSELLELINSHSEQLKLRPKQMNNFDTVFKSKNTLLAEHSAKSYAEGYNDGITEFINTKGVDISPFIFKLEGILKDEEGLVDLIKGMGLESPVIPANYPNTEFGGIESLIIPDQVKNMFSEHKMTKEGYKLGFMIGIAKKYGVLIKAEDVPADISSFMRFNRGLSGEPDLTGRDLKIDDYIRTFNSYDDPNKAYHLGLKIWLRSQGIRDVDAKQIMQPHALKAFKTALRGEVIHKFEENETKKDRFNIIKHTPNITVKNSDLYAYTQNTNPSALLEEQQAREGYMLGKAARERNEGYRIFGP